MAARFFCSSRPVRARGSDGQSKTSCRRSTFFFLHCRSSTRHCRSTTGNSKELKRELNAEISLEKHSKPKHNKHKTNKNTQQHTSKQKNKTPRPVKIRKMMWNRWNTPRPSQPLIASLPPCSNPPSHPCKVQMSVMSMSVTLLWRVSHVRQESTTLELVSTLFGLPPLCTMFHKCLYLSHEHFLPCPGKPE